MACTGRCLCGAVTYTAAADPVGVRMCWCRDCQYIASGSPTVNALFPEDSVTYSGVVSNYRMVADSGNTVERGFCPTCGAQLYSRTVEPAGSQPLRVRVGTLEQPETARPQAHIWVDSAPPWARIDPELPQYHKGPDSARVGAEP